MIRHRSIARGALLASISALPILIAAPPAFADDVAIEEVIITATRRESTVQDAPINISAITGDTITQQGFNDLSEITAYVPGVHLVDQGGRDGNRIVVRGLNADPLGSSEGVGNGNGGMVATYLGDVPLSIDLRLHDMERVEFLLGPQGTLYGSGTMAGAIRYIPVRPSFAAPELTLRGSAYNYGEADGISSDIGFTANYPITDTLAVRASVDYLDDTGFIDYAYVVDEIGVSDPDNFDGTQTHKVEDANTEETLTTRLAFRWQPNDAMDANLTWYHQDQDVGARQVSSKRVDSLPVEIGEYEAALRVLEPNDRTNDLVALEMVFDVGFASLTSATSFSRYEELGHRDQTDLLIGLEYGYEGFPSFTSITEETGEEETFNQEVRLVSTGDGPLSWIIGGFYNRFDSEDTSKEFTPHLPEYWGVDRPDNLEYYSVNRTKLIEQAVFGEISYRFLEAWQVTIGARKYGYELVTEDAVDFPLLYSLLGVYGPDEINLEFVPGGQEDDGWLYKFNTSYDITDDVMVYGTISQGYRIGNSNGVGPCPDPLPSTQISCGLPNEMAYYPDKTLNYEIGLHSQWLDRRLTLNGAIFYVDWSDPQVAAATENGLIPITKNGSAAESKGVELDFVFKPIENLILRGNYSYSHAELTEVTENLIPRINPPGFQGTITYEDGEPGDRLPGAPEHQGSFFADYTWPLSNGMEVNFSYGISYTGDVLTRMGGRGGGITLDSYSISDLSVGLNGESWDVTLFAKNLFDEYAETGARNTPLYNQVVEDDDGGPVYARNFYTSVAPPRVIGVRFTKSFGG